MSDETEYKPTVVPVTTELPLDDLAFQIVRSNATHEQILQFVFDIDNYVADLDFTIALHEGLTEIIESELGDDA